MIREFKQTRGSTVTLPNTSTPATSTDRSDLGPIGRGPMTSAEGQTLRHTTLGLLLLLVHLAGIVVGLPLGGQLVRL